jgi:hypothetical protein
MKIGILTFHWATNYGAILQAYALQTYLKKRGHDVYIINYRPKQHKKTLLGCFYTLRFWLYFNNLKAYIKERKLESFRKGFLHETLLYESLDQLKNKPPKFNIYICGSDQIWNPFFTQNGEGKATSSYFLDFGEKSVKRIAYAVSFGCEVYPEIASSIAKKYIFDFVAISVRENSGLDIVSRIGRGDPIKLPDPTLLLNREEYYFGNTNLESNPKSVFIYVLRGDYKEVKKIRTHLQRYYKTEDADKLFISISVENWVQKIKNSSFVVTNSFHGMVFSIIFHVPFVVVLSSGSDAGMNDRFKTLLTHLNLNHRMLNVYDSDVLNRLVDEQIDWEKVDCQLMELRNRTLNFFDEYLN